MITLTGQTGDWAIRTDTGTVFILTSSNAGSAANWREVAYPAAPVTSVNGQTGVVTLDADDLAEGAANKFLTNGERNKLSNIETNAKDDQSASEVPYSPSGPLTANQVQGAIDQLVTLVSNIVSGVSSVNGQSGAVVLTTTNIAEGTRLYFTNARVAAYLDRKIITKETLQNNSSESWATYLTGAFTLAFSAMYEVTVAYAWYLSSTSNDFEARLLVDGVNVSEHRQEPQDSGDDQRYQNQMIEFTTLAAGAHTFQLQFRVDNDNSTASIVRGRIAVERYV
jgi:hypothetical protein